MLDCGSKEHGRHLPARFGDWSGTIRNGRIQPARQAAR
ncbi:hypothetical protein M878_06955 [Streptomyces roseochromogenus subsp. oscitans DS 12.976]|uniref:Uncharacterized protein n=1 Tax=Streptomyces roseochromogenus subsp. oscitans DS 12.976 TaxID=1352936 RepID=V6KT74_STRRC|nr:hypothetical protein M878_06955 [Streptomyces roseochromogenus subsp. oscitans DS 12.976]